MRRSTLILFLLVLAALGSSCSKSPEQKLAEHKEKARSYLASGKVDEAMIEIRNALQASSKDKEALALAGEIYLKKGQPQDAFSAYHQLAEVDPSNLDAQVKLGGFFLLGGEPAEARKRAEKVIAAAPNRADGRLLLGNVLLREGKPAEALAEFDRAIGLDPKNSQGRIAKAGTLLGLGRFDESRKVLAEILAAAPTDAAALLMTAQVADLQKDQPAVDDAFARLLKAKGGEPWTWIRYGDYWLSKGEVPKALDAFRKAGGLDKKGTAGWEKVAEVAFRRGDQKEAGEAVAAMGAIAPKGTATTYYKARLLLLQGKLPEAIAGLQQVVKEYPKNAEAHYYLAEAYRGQRNPELTKGELQKAIELAPKAVPPKLLLAQVHLETKQFEQALRITDELVKGDRVQAGAVLLRALALQGVGKRAEGRKLLEELTAKAPGYAAAHEKLGIVYASEKQDEKALASFQRALEAEPKNLRPLAFSVQVLLLSQKRPDQAIAKVEGHVKKAGDSAGARELLANAYRAKGDLEGARREAERAIQLDPKAMGGYMLLASLHKGPDSTRKAIQDLDRGLAARPEHLQGWMLKGALHDSLRETEEANKAYRKVLERDRDFVPALNNLAWNLADKGGNVDEALKFAERAVELSPNAPALNDTLGWIYVKKGVYGKAAEHLETAAEGLEGNAEVYYHLGKAYAGLGEKRKAVASLRKALALSKTFSGAQDAAGTLKGLGG